MKKRYPIVLAFLVLGGGIAFFLVEEGNGGGSEVQVEKSYSCYFIGRFPENEELGMLLLKRGKALVEDEELKHDEEQLPDIFEDPERLELEPASNGYFSLFYGSSKRFTKQELIRATKDLVNLDVPTGERKGELDADFDTLYSSGVRLRKNRVRKNDPLIRGRAFVVILIMSAMLGLFVASVLERPRTGT